MKIRTPKHVSSSKRSRSREGKHGKIVISRYRTDRIHKSKAHPRFMAHANGENRDEDEEFFYLIIVLINLLVN